MSRIIFVTGTDTGVGKTVMTGLLLAHLRTTGVKALAMKPFCSGGRGDVALLQSLQFGQIPDKVANPFYFSQPLAPGIAAGKAGKKIRIEEALRAIAAVSGRCDCLLIEGAGGLLVPLGERFSVLDLISALACDVVLVGTNKLGVINHTLLSAAALRARGIGRVKIVLMNPRRPDLSARTNPEIIAESLENIEVFTIPHLGADAVGTATITAGAKKNKKTLARIIVPDIFSPRCSDRKSKAKRNEPTGKRKLSLTVDAAESKTDRASNM